MATAKERARRTRGARPAASGPSGFARGSVRSWTDPGLTWTWPAIAGGLFLLSYFLGYFDVIETPIALAGCIFLLLATVLFFPMRYAERLDLRGRILAGAYAVVWMAAAFYPIWDRCSPAERIVATEVTSTSVPQTLAVAGRGARLDLVIDGHLPPSETGVAHSAQYMITVEAEGLPPQTFTGDFKDRWSRQRSGRRSSVEVHDEMTSSWAVVENPSQQDLRLTLASVKGQAEDRLSLTLHRHRLLPGWMTLALAVLLLVGALVFDARTGAGDTAASMVIATAAVLCGSSVFPYVGSPNPSFREMIGAVIVAALVGGPLGGLVAWLFRRRTEDAAGRRPRRRG